MNALNYYHYNDYKKFTNTRGMVLARPASLGALRYPILYSGETKVSWDTLKKLPEYISSAYNMGITWWSHGKCSATGERICRLHHKIQR